MKILIVVFLRLFEWVMIEHMFCLVRNCCLLCKQQ